MFWQKYVELCDSVGKTPNAVAAEIGIRSSGTVTGWKNGSVPRANAIRKICNYFGLPLEYFDEPGWDAVNNGVANVREEIRNSYAYRILFDTASDATEADLLEAAALIARRKEERGS